jgi:hypothetical protein
MHQNVEIVRGPRMPVERDGVPAEHHEVHRGVRELDQQIAKVVGELDHASRRGTKRTGISARA